MKDLKIFTENIEQEATNQIYKLLEQEPFTNSKIRIMPDVHAGAGCVIGFTGDLGNKVIPNIVGVDIGCGMRVIELGKIDIDFAKLDEVIKAYVPAGRDVHEECDSKSEEIISKLYCVKELHDMPRLKSSLGTLGGGNHFIEIDIDDDENKYLVIHTGSRNLGKQVCDIYQDLAVRYCHKGDPEAKKKLIAQLKADNRCKDIQAELKKFEPKYGGVPTELCFLESENRMNYLHDMTLCQEWAVLNREYIAKTICDHMGWTPNRYAHEAPLKQFETIHNYIENMSIVRKGAVAAYKGQELIIPMNMRDGSLICIGKGNEDWNCSAPHGAGRIMSRSKARELLDIEEYKKSMEGIYTTTVDTSTIDEAPMVYKPIEEIISCIGDTVEITKIIKPVYNFKAAE